MAKKFKIGVLTFGDGREFLKKDLETVNANFQKKVKTHLENDGFEVLAAEEVIWQNRLAVKYGKMMRAADVDCVIFNYCVWAWPGFARVAAQFCPKPIILYANLNPGYPAMVGMLANAGSLDQIGIPFFKIFGELTDKKIYEKLKAAILGISAFNRMKGLTYVNVGGRSLSIDTAIADPALWMEKFGIDVDHVDQMELVRRAELELENPAKVEKALAYCRKHVRKIHWTKDDATMKCTEDLVKRSLAMYYAMTDLCDEFGYDFCGIKGQRELTEHYATSDIPEAVLNDYYGPAGEPHDPIVCSTEADMDAALTMQIFNLITGQPVLFADIRSYYDDKKIWDLCNSGAHATYFAGKSKDPIENLKNVEFRPEGFYYPAGGASVYHIAKPGEVTLARLARSGSTTHYKLVVVHGEFVSFGAEEDEKLAAIEQDNWPHAFCRFDCDMETFIQGINCNHIHGTYGNWVEELKVFCRAADIEFVLLG
ncbi:MAG: fucose isomerase [Spirochaetales bacterium]|nr:MAG: fucose isomerase [Spirochaetales bacterium]